MPVNANPDFVQAEDRYHKAKTDEERLEALEEMLTKAPKHKSSENFVANLKTRYKKLKAQATKKSSSGKFSGISIKKSDMQAVIIGKTKSGKSSLLGAMTNNKPEVADYEFTTKKPEIGMLGYIGVQIQLIENPAINSDYYDRGLTNGADTLLLLVNSLEEIKEIKELTALTERASGKKIIVFNKSDLLTENEKRRIFSTLQSKKYNFVIVSAKEKENLEELKEKLFQSFGRIRIHTKEPGKEPSNKPVVLNPGSTVKDIAEKILHGFSAKVKETRIWGPSSKFPGQSVGLKHILKDKDVVEFKTK